MVMMRINLAGKEDRKRFQRRLPVSYFLGQHKKSMLDGTQAAVRMAAAKALINTLQSIRDPEIARRLLEYALTKTRYADVRLLVQEFLIFEYTKTKQTGQTSDEVDD